MSYFSKPVLLSIFLAAFNLISAQAQMNMRQLSVNDGLSQYYVSDIEQDKYGFIWIATYDGLNRYDGAVVKVYKSDPGDPGSLSSSRIKSLYFDSTSNRLFIGTDGGGINVYDYATDSFRSYNIRHNSNIWLPENDIIDIKPERGGRLWIVTRQIIFLVEITSDDIFVKQTIVYPVNRLINSLITIDGALLTIAKHRVVRYVCSDGAYIHDVDIIFPGGAVSNSVSVSGDSVFFSTTQGIFCLAEPYTGKSLSRLSISDRGILSDMEDVAVMKKHGSKIYFVVSSKGLYCLDEASGKIEHISTSADDFWEDNIIRNTMVDRSNTMWLASEDKGVGFVDLEQVVYRKIDLYEGNQPCIYSLMLDSDNKLWIGTETKGVFLMNGDTGMKRVFQGPGPVTDIKYFRDGSVMLVSDGKVYSWSGNAFEEIFPLGYEWAEDLGTVFNVCEDSSGTIWLGCRKGIAGLSGENHVISKLETSFFLSVIPSKSGDALWVCSGRSGLMRYKIGEGLSLVLDRHYTNSPDSAASISSNTVRTVFESQTGNIYVGTEAGLDCIDSETLNVSRVMGGDILSSSSVFAIQEDSKGVLWVNTSRGIVRYDPRDGSEKIYDSSDGLVSSFMTPASAISDEDSLYVGTNSGINVFCTADLPIRRKIPPQIAVTGIDVFGEPMLFESPVMDMDRIILSHNQNNLVFHLGVMSYGNPKKNIYLYRLLGYDDEWVTTGSNNPTAAFNKLKKGHYTFEFKGMDANHTPSADTVSIDVVVRPAWWNTVVAYCIYAMFFAGLIYFIIMYIMDRTRRKSEMKANEAKLCFYDNLTHELRTPLTLVSAPMAELAGRQDLPHDVSEKFVIMQRNVERLLNFVNHFLELRKIDNDALPLMVKKQDVAFIFKNVVNSFTPLASQKHIHILCSVQEEQMFGYVDEDKFTMILTNLLSNALKFTFSDGHVTASLRRENSEYVVSVADDGCGISSKDLARIFERFYQVETHPVSGTGIGLDLSRSLAELHKGWLKGTSKLGEGSTFTFGFPYEKEKYDSSEIASDNDAEVPAAVEVEAPDVGTKEIQKPKILIVEDDMEMLAYLKSILDSKYAIFCAANGKDGLSAALEIMPDMIVSDVMMPVMDGISMCRMINEDFRTSHIPVIMLTAKTDELSGLQAGAVDYIMKPFNPQNLLLKMSNLLKYRISLRIPQDSGQTISDRIKEYGEQREREFLEKVYSIVASNLSKSEFNVEELMKEIGVSKSQLHKKMTALTGQPASVFVRNIRLDKAREMLMTGRYTISEVLYSVGFNSPSYFSKMFRARFGVLPSEMLRNG